MPVSSPYILHPLHMCKQQINNNLPPSYIINTEASTAALPPVWPAAKEFFAFLREDLESTKKRQKHIFQQPTQT